MYPVLPYRGHCYVALRALWAALGASSLDPLPRRGKRGGLGLGLATSVAPHHLFLSTPVILPHHTKYPCTNHSALGILPTTYPQDTPMGDIMQSLQKDLTPRQRAMPDRIYSRKAIEQAFIETFGLVGGVPRLAQWASDDQNYGQFLSLLMKLAPKEMLQEQSGVVIEYRSNIPQSPLNRPPADEVIVE